IHLPRAERLDNRVRQGLHVDFQANRQSGRWIDSRNDVVHAQNISPELFVAERVVAEDLTTRFDPAVLVFAWLAVRDRTMSGHRLELRRAPGLWSRSRARGQRGQ